MFSYNEREKMISIADVCYTISGVRCIFPFTKDGEIFHACSDFVNEGFNWCATEVDKNGEYIEGYTCAANCPIQGIPV